MLMKIGSILNYNILIDDCYWEQIMCWSDLSDYTFNNWFCVQRLPDCDVIEFMIVPWAVPKPAKDIKNITDEVVFEAVSEQVVQTKKISESKQQVSSTKKFSTKKRK